MKALSILILSITIFYGKILEFKTYRSDFKQIITNNSNSKIIYKGEIYLTSNSNILWKYISPIEKFVYINKLRVMIVEPELEQVIVSNMSKDLDLLNIINHAKKISNNLYENTINNISYKIKLKNNLLESINYIDEIENHVEILFRNSKKNLYLKKDLFKFVIPNEYDIIRK